ncbi:MAG: MAPEG family protein [Myxococcales bacterium]|nr:MAPEG family protein [Myxococcales bacterium]
MTTLAATTLYGSLLTILLVCLSIYVGLLRLNKRIMLGTNEDPQLTKASRAQGNAAEYIPTGIVMLLVCELLGATSMAAHSLGGAFLLGRLLHAIGILGTNPGRLIGINLTWASMAAMAGYALMLKFG